MRRDNSVSDFCPVGVALADAKKRLRLVNVILMNASVRGPFLPAYAHVIETGSTASCHC